MYKCNCGEVDSSNFYGRRKTLCKSCYNKQRVQEFIDLKIKAIEYKDGKCLSCGYSKFYGALEFHHLDPTQKDVAWNKLRLRPWDKVKMELDKCILLCANCHREEHANLLAVA